LKSNKRICIEIVFFIRKSKFSKKKFINNIDEYLKNDLKQLFILLKKNLILRNKRELKQKKNLIIQNFLNISFKTNQTIL
jgi:hypothetical protein